MTSVEATTFRTGDLAEASVLSMHGLTPSFENGLAGQAVFVFVLADDDDPEFIKGLLEDLRHSKCRVEPKRFARELKHVREALYDFLRVDRQSRRLHQSS